MSEIAIIARADIARVDEAIIDHLFLSPLVARAFKVLVDQPG